ncbi:MAG TPA: alkaline phosphatase family protein, partial [Planctomycetota bacterium]|nr:alkaline phosphatase family protein [Planctomycetota bacterium]
MDCPAQRHASPSRLSSAVHTGLLAPLVLVLALATACRAQQEASALPTAASAAAVETEPAGRPRLLVLVVIDQCRAEYLQRFLPLLPEGGFRRLLAEGAVFPAAAHTHTVTSTAPGHAAIATGCLPARAGIPENEFLENGRPTYCVADAGASLVGSLPGLRPAGVSARKLERPTLGDLLQQSCGPAALVVSFAWKDRAALLMGGHDSDGSYWLEPDDGSWVTTSALRPALPDWLVALNARGDLAAASGSTWERRIDEARAIPFSGIDDAPGESVVAGARPVFPHHLPRAESAAHGGSLRTLCRQLAGTPAADEEVLAAVRGALEHEALGRDDTPDLLCVGFSALDYAGHDYGPASQEVLELFLALDRRLAELLALLDGQVGAGRWTLALTSDHGVGDLPEQSGALRLTQEDLRQQLEAGLQARLGPVPAGAAHWLAALLKPSVWIDRQACAAAGKPLPEVAQAAAEVLAGLPGIELAATRATLAAALADAAAPPDLRALAADVHPTRSGEVLFLLTRGTLLARDVAADHGSHHPEDRSVPLLLCGAGIARIHSPSAAAP